MSLLHSCYTNLSGTGKWPCGGPRSRWEDRRLKWTIHRVNTVSKVNRHELGDQVSWQKHKFFPLPQHPNQLWDLPRFHFSGKRGQAGHSVKLTIHLQDAECVDGHFTSSRKLKLASGTWGRVLVKSDVHIRLLTFRGGCLPTATGSAVNATIILQTWRHYVQLYQTFSHTEPSGGAMRHSIISGYGFIPEIASFRAFTTKSCKNLIIILAIYSCVCVCVCVCPSIHMWLKNHRTDFHEILHWGVSLKFVYWQFGLKFNSPSIHSVTRWLFIAMEKYSSKL
jgi:hypothetical protein